MRDDANQLAGPAISGGPRQPVNVCPLIQGFSVATKIQYTKGRSIKMYWTRYL